MSAPFPQGVGEEARAAGRLRVGFSAASPSPLCHLGPLTRPLRAMSTCDTRNCPSSWPLPLSLGKPSLAQTQVALGGAGGRCRQAGSPPEGASGERKALSRHSEPQPPPLLFHYSSLCEALPPLPDPGPAREMPLPPPTLHPPQLETLKQKGRQDD